MRRTLLLLLVLTGCAGPDSDPVEVAERFHALRVEGEDRAVYALLTTADRAATPPETFPTELPTSAMLEVLGWDARLDSAVLAGGAADTARVALFLADGERDTLRLVATHDPQDLWLFERDRVTWRVSMRLAERAMVDSLATLVQENEGTVDSASIDQADAYLRSVEGFPEMARPADLDAARALLRAAAVADALEIDVRLAQSIEGVPFIEGRVVNPTDRRINTLTLVVRDATGAEEEVELWDIGPADSTAIWRLTRLERRPLRHRVGRIRVF